MMIPVTAQWIADAVGGTLAAEPTIEVTSVENDSRKAVAGTLYVAFPGERADGHDFVPQAADAGATLHMVTRAVDAPHLLVDDAQRALGALARAYLALARTHHEMTVIGVTGSVGKTTVKDLLAGMLPDCVAPVGSFNNEVGLPLTVLRTGTETRFLVLEMGASGAGHIKYLTDIAPLDVAAVLAVGHAHMGQYGSLDDVARAKAEIIAGVTPGGTIVLNAADSRVATMDPRGRTTVTYGTAQSDVSARDLTVDAGMPGFTLCAQGSDVASVTLGLIGEHHISNALAAAALAHVAGLSWRDIAAGLEGAAARSPHRMAITRRADGVTVLDDAYNASPESMRAALRALKDVANRGRTFAVLGEMLEMGDARIEEHDALGETVVRLRIDRLIVVGEGAKPLFDGAVREGSWGDEAVFVATIDEARALLRDELREGDTVLLKGSHGTKLWQLADHVVAGDTTGE